MRQEVGQQQPTTTAVCTVVVLDLRNVECLRHLRVENDHQRKLQRARTSTGAIGEHHAASKCNLFSFACRMMLSNGARAAYCPGPLQFALVVIFNPQMAQTLYLRLVVFFLVALAHILTCTL